tara:strand:+ start:822 stop:1382 length:561 start_codon:yes stop_codon:yes gene_type:complete
MQTPLGILAEKIDDKSVKEVLNVLKKNKKKLTSGKVGKGMIDESTKKSLDLCINPPDLDSLIPNYMKSLGNVVHSYKLRFPEVHNDDYHIREAVNVQLYKPGAGFYRPHYERHFHSFHRLLTFMTYLTDNPNGGTFFKYQDFYCPAVKGLTLVWPADFTYTHNGVVDYNKDKIIITGWLNWMTDTR